jgi:hypothetical protein
MKKLVDYKDCTIQAYVYPIEDSGRWGFITSIIRHEKDTKFSSSAPSNTYETEEEAIKHAINYGRQMIDGQAREG